MRNHLALLLCLLGMLSIGSVVLFAQSEPLNPTAERSFHSELRAIVGQRVWLVYYESGRVGLTISADSSEIANAYEYWIRGVGVDFVKLTSQSRSQIIPFQSISRLTWH